MNRRTKKRRHHRGRWIVLIAVVILFWGGKSAFSVVPVEDVEELEPGLALPAFAYSIQRGAGPTLADLHRLSFQAGDEDVLTSDGAGEEDGDEPAAAPAWMENAAAAEPVRGAERPGFRVASVVIKRGQSLKTIAARAGITVRTLTLYNRLSSQIVRPGQKLQIPNDDGLRVRVTRGQTLGVLARLYHVRINDILDVNDLTRASDVKAGSELFLPGAQPLPQVTRHRTDRGRSHGAEGGVAISSSRTLWAWPVAGGRLSSRFGYRRHPISGKIQFHRGIDIAAPMGSSVHAYRAGVIVYAGPRGGYGFVVEIAHDNGIVTRYAHNSKLTTRVGRRVRAGDEIAKTGSSGYSTGPHVHFEVIRRGERIDPLKFLARA